MSDVVTEEQAVKTGSYVKVGKGKVMLKTLRTIFLSLTLVVVGMGIGYQMRDRGLLSSIGGTLFSANPVGLSRENLDFRMFWEVWDRLEADYVDPEDIDAQKMVYGAIAGMTAAVGDPYTVFLPPQENQQVKEDLSGEFDGIGVQLGYKNEMLAVMSPLDDHPAIKQGVRAGDIILHIKDEGKGIDQDTNGLSLPEAVTLIRGKKGTTVTLTFYREDRGEFELDIVRSTITIPSVTLEWGDSVDGVWVESENGSVAWVKLRRFGDNTQQEWDSVVRDVINRGNNYQGMVLDMRNNPGGYLNAAVSIASDFIPEGVIVSQQGRKETRDYTVEKRARLLGQNVVVLINGGSASASEILAGALRDRLNVKLVGEKSFGKGTVQEALDLHGDAGLHVTTSRWLLPNGDWIHESGIEPHVEIAFDNDQIATEGAELIDNQLLGAIKELKLE